MTRVASVKGMNKLELGDATYWFATPSVYDMPKLRRRLTLEGVRLPTRADFEAAAIAGVRALAVAAEEAEEGERQVDLIERFYRAIVVTDEDDIDEPDIEKRFALFKEREETRRAELAAVTPEVLLIQANLDRHWPAWRELRADENYWTEVSRIDTVRLLLTHVGDLDLARDKDGWITEAAYAALPDEHLAPLGTFAMGLLAPTETERKN
jgi:hypothetical protein